MTEKTYTKGDIMAALNKLKTPEPMEVSLPELLNDTAIVKDAIIGAEALVDALDGEEKPRRKMMLRLTMMNLADLMGEPGFGIVEEAEKATTPPRGVMRDAA